MKRKALSGLVVLVALAAVLGWQRGPVLSWLYFRQLGRAADQEREGWVSRLISLDTSAQSGAIAWLRSAAAVECELGETVLTGLAANWSVADERTTRLLQELLDGFASFGQPGKRAALRVAGVMLDREVALPVAASQAAETLLRRGAGELKASAPVLFLAGVLAKRGAGDGKLTRALLMRGLKSDEAEDRTQAARLLLLPPFREETALLGMVVPLLRDASSQARRAALLVVSGHADLASDDDLLPLLHDEDPEVGRLCETALRSRGLSDDHLTLARLISDERPAARLQVLHHLGATRDLDPAVWLRRLCQDPASAVRAAAIRAAADQRQPDLVEHLLHMSQTDPSPTIRQLAEHYLKRKR